MSDLAGPDVPSCEAGSPYNGSLGLRVGGLFIILVTSLIGTLFPIIARRVPQVKIPHAVWEFAKYFGAGVIIATAFIHLLDPALEALGNECLTGTWTVYPWALAICMISVFGIFLLELFAYRVGIAWMEKSGVDVVDTHGPGVAHGPERPSNHSHLPDHHHSHAHEHGAETLLPPSSAAQQMTEKESAAPRSQAKPTDLEVGSDASGSDVNSPMLDSYRVNASSAAQIIGVAILEFGVVVHSVVIGLTLAVTDEFDTLFVVIIFHQMFEGLGLGTRLSQMPLPRKLNYVPMTAGAFYAFMTPLGMAIGLGVRTTYNPESVTASIVSGILDSISAGILLWTGLVELLAHQFIFNEEMRKAPLGKVMFAVVCTCLGAGIMALLGRWA